MQIEKYLDSTYKYNIVLQNSNESCDLWVTTSYLPQILRASAI